MLNLISCIHLPLTIENDTKLEFVEINNYKFHVITFGNKNNPPLLIIHGGPGGDSKYLYSLKELSNNYYVIFYDQRGTGLSPRVPKEQLTLESSLEDLNHIVEHFKKDGKIKLIGHSWGAMLAIGYLSQHGNNVSHAIAVEPGILNTTAAIDFSKQIKNNRSLSDILFFLGTILKTPFVSVLDGNECFDYVMTKMLNRNKPGGIYQCSNDSMPANAFTRAGFESFNNMLKPVLDDPRKFTADLTKGSSNYNGHLLMISSECSFIGYDFQTKYHMPFLPESTVHIKAKSMGHNMLTLNASWSLEVINDFLKR